MASRQKFRKHGEGGAAPQDGGVGAKKHQQKQENDNTVKFVQAKEEALEQQKTDKKQKWEFPFLKRTAEAKIE